MRIAIKFYIVDRAIIVRNKVSDWEIIILCDSSDVSLSSLKNCDLEKK